MSDRGTSEIKTGVEELKRERYELLQRLEDWLETPMLVLAFVWLVLLVVELIRDESLLFYFLGTIIWVCCRVLDKSILIRMSFTYSPTEEKG